MGLVLIAGCANSPPPAAAVKPGAVAVAVALPLPPGFFVPAGAFSQSPGDLKQSTSPIVPELVTTPSSPGVISTPAPLVSPPVVLLAPPPPLPLPLPVTVTVNKTGTVAGAIPSGFFIPAGTFGKVGNDANQVSDAPIASVAPAPAVAVISKATQAPTISVQKLPLTAPSVEPLIILYASPVTKAYLAKMGIDAAVNIQVWAIFLRKYQIPFQIATSTDQLEKTLAKVLLLPSSVALSDREKQAVLTFRGKGGGVLSSWLAGVRDENGHDVGFGFMENALDVKVVGDTEADAKDNFMMPHGDSPVTHYLPAGIRIWLDRVKGLYPLRLSGRNPAAHIMDWSRSPVLGKSTTTLVFDETVQSSGKQSRSVVLGYPEQLWLSADPKQMEAIAYNALVWMLRQPAAYISAWPYPYGSALVMAVDVTDVVAETDVSSAKLFEKIGGRSTYFVLSDTAAKSAEKLKKLTSDGHEIAYLGDSFADFREQPLTVQAKRFDTMRKVLDTAGLGISPAAGFHAPMDSYDKNTEKILKEGTFGYMLASMDASEARLPFFSSIEASSDLTKAMVVLPRTQNGPEDAVDNCAPEIGLRPFLNELDLAEKMAGLSVVALPSKNELTHTQVAEIFNDLNTRRERMWLTTAGQVADWWRERERVSVQLTSAGAALQLTVTIAPGPPLRKASAIWINLPNSDSSVRLVPQGSYEKAPKIATVDAWRAAVVLEGLAAGQYQWKMHFDRTEPGIVK